MTSTKEAGMSMYEMQRNSALYESKEKSGAVDSELAKWFYKGFDAGYESARDQWTECPNCKSGIADGYLEIINERDTDGGEIDLVGCPVCDHEWEQPYQQGGE